MFRGWLDKIRELLENLKYFLDRVFNVKLSNLQNTDVIQDFRNVCRSLILSYSAMFQLSADPGSVFQH